jgi:hypothetical protein
MGARKNIWPALIACAVMVPTAPVIETPVVATPASNTAHYDAMRPRFHHRHRPTADRQLARVGAAHDRHVRSAHGPKLKGESLPKLRAAKNARLDEAIAVNRHPELDGCRPGTSP